MGPELLDQQVQDLRSRAARYRKIGGLLGDAEAATTLNRLAAELDDAVQALVHASNLIGTTVEGAHRLWAELSFLSLMPTLRTQNALRIATADDWRELSGLWMEEAESSKHHPDKELLAERAFEIAQLAEKLARDAASAAESRFG